MTLHPNQFLRFPDKTAMMASAAELLVQGLAGKTAPSINLTGGGTIVALYQLLAKSYRDQIDWPSLRVTWGDERLVPRSSPDHNGSAAWRDLLSHVPVSADLVQEIPTELGSAEAGAAAYQAVLQNLKRPGLPLFDVTLLSLGDDGHIASLLPGQPVLDETTALVAAVPHGRSEQRITLTYPALRQSGLLLLIVSGAAKAKVLADLLAGAEQYPASRLKVDGQLVLLADEAALGGAA